MYNIFGDDSQNEEEKYFNQSNEQIEEMKVSKEQEEEILDQCSSQYLNCLPLAIFKNQQKAKIFACKYSKTDPKGIANNPLQNTKGEIFCKQCYAIAKKENQINENLTALALPLKQILSDFQVDCLNREQGCKFENTLSNLLTKHLPYECEFMKIHCPNEQCTAITERRFINDHLSQCQFQLIKCEFCQEEIFLGNKDKHKETCPETEINCPNCNIFLKRKCLQEHKENDCIYIQCEICECNINKNKLAEHILQDPTKHFQYFQKLGKKVTVLREKLKESKEKTQNLLKLANSRLGQELYFGTECSNCKKQLTESSAQFYCFTCDIYFCQKCGDKINTSKEGTESLIHKHYLVYIQVKNKNGMKNIDLYRFGMNVWFKQDSSSQHQIQCDGCRQKPKYKTARYICLSCPNQECRQAISKGFQYSDFCQECINTLRNRDIDPQAFKKMKEIAKIEAPFHDFDSCIYLKVQFANYHYSNF